ncbi:synaptobrevin-domain-containing protein [Lipomyces tetrasporus]|uniref:Synaptobrevin homolog YKT6 n=1 Tax=Lipomyces tetrasporus TaxID=54092 RepID=A0AAD7QSM7_9ASCO|nr:synaptobrevin-domain-containing protein [Lipomyces tetrasporus]KAJ8100723.1 synaptobrevin-domain-containing protein [Lipomyces tetrasporus]
MPASNFLYACVAHGTTVLADYAPLRSNANAVAALILPKIPAEEEQKLTYIHNNWLVHYITTASSEIVPDGVTFLAITLSTVPRRVPFAYLVDVQRKFNETFSPEQVGESDQPYALASFSHTLGQLMAKADSPDADRATVVRQEINQVKDIMSENIERVIERGERIDILVDKTDHMNQTAFAFRKRSTALRRQMWWKNKRLVVLIIIAIIFLIYVLIGFGCGLPSWQNCGRRNDQTEQNNNDNNNNANGNADGN